MPQPSQRIFYLDALRAIAIVGVVMLHTAATGWVATDPTASSWQVYNIYDSLVRWCVPVFVMLSGALMLDPGRTVTFQRLLRKNVARLALVFAVWSALYLVWDVSQGVVEPTSKALLSALVSGHYHLWYLQLQAFLYLCVPLLRPVVADLKLAGLLVVLTLLFSFVPNFLFMSQVASDVFGNAYGHTAASLTCGYLGYFVLGSILVRTELPRGARLVLYAGGVVCVVFTAGATSWLSVSAGFARGELYGYLMPNTLLPAAALFVAVRQVFSGRRAARLAPSLLGRALAALASASFGIYLAHVLVLEVFGCFGLGPDFVAPALGVPLLCAWILVVSFVLVRLLGRIPFLRRLV